MLVILPYLDRRIVFYLRIGDGPFHSRPAALVEYQVVIDCRHTCILPLRRGSVQHQVYRLTVVQCPEQMEPAEWEEMAPALAESPGNGREVHPETGDAALGIDEEAGYAVVEHRDDLVGFLPNLLIGERDEIVNALLETAVVDVENQTS